MQLNTVTLVGNLTADPEIRYTRDGVAHTSFRLATRRTDDSGDTPQVIDVRCDADLAENVALSLVPGDRVVVAGAVVVETTNNSGKDASAVTVHAEEIGPTLRFTMVQIHRPEDTSHYR